MRGIKVFSPVLAALLCAATLAGCATQTDAPTASIGNITILRQVDPPPVQVGVFALAPGKPAAMDRSINVRGSTQTPVEKSLARHLGEVLKTELQAVGKLNPSSPVVIEGLLTESSVNSGLASQGSGALGATFIVKRDGRVIFEKNLRVAATWESSFLGAIAIPEAMNQHEALFQKLVAALFSDAEFVAALRRP